MSNFTLIIYCGFTTFLTRFSMIALLKKEMFESSEKTKFEKAHGHDEASECALVQDTRNV